MYEFAAVEHLSLNATLLDMIFKITNNNAKQWIYG